MAKRTQIKAYPVDSSVKAINIENTLRLTIINQLGVNFKFYVQGGKFEMLPNQELVFVGDIEAPLNDVIVPITVIPPDPTLTVLIFATEIYEYEDKH